MSDAAPSAPQGGASSDPSAPRRGAPEQPSRIGASIGDRLRARGAEPPAAPEVEGVRVREHVRKPAGQPKGAPADEQLAELRSGTQREAPVEGAEGEGEGGEREADTGERYEITVDGEKLQVTLAELKAGFSKNRAAMKRFEAAHKLRQEAEQVKAESEAKLNGLLERMGQDPQAVWRVVEALGHDPLALAEDLLARDLERRKRPPHELELEEERRRRMELEQRWQAEEERRRRAQEEESQRTEFAQARQAIEQEFRTALGRAGLPVDGFTMARLAAYAEAYDGVDGVATDDLAEMVREERLSVARSWLEQLEGDDLVSALGPAADKVRKHFVDRYSAGHRTGRVVEAPRPVQAASPPQEGSRRAAAARVRQKLGLD